MVAHIVHRHRRPRGHEQQFDAVRVQERNELRSAAKDERLNVPQEDARLLGVCAKAPAEHVEADVVVSLPPPAGSGSPHVVHHSIV